MENNTKLMKSRDRRDLKRRLIFMVLVCSCLHLFALHARALPLSIEEETILGEKFLAQLRKEFHFVKDDFANEYVNELGQYLVRPLETKPFPFRFFLIKDARLNAFAAPGGNIFVFSGLVVVMESVDELAGVICHEIAHVSARHLAQRIEQNKKIGLATMAGALLGALIGGKTGATVATGSAAAGIQTQLHYSREDERQADQLGFNYTNEAGYDPSGLISVLNKMERQQWGSSDKIPAYLQTHPTGPERMTNLETLLRQAAPGPVTDEGARLKSLFPFFKTVLIAESSTPRDAQMRFENELRTNPDSTMAHFGLGIVLKEKTEYPGAIDHFQRALEKSPETLPVLQQLADTYLLSKLEREAISVLESALRIDAQNKATLFLLAKAYEDLEEYPKAVDLYGRLTTREPVKDEVFYNLGISYGKMDRFAMAHYNFGLYFRRTGDMEKARFHFQKAYDLSQNDPVLRTRINHMMRDLSPR